MCGMLGYAPLKRGPKALYNMDLKEGKMGKKLEQIDPLEYGISGKELIAAAAVKAYLRVLPPQMAATQLSQAIKPKMIRIYERDAHCLPLPVDSLIDGKNLAGLIRRSLNASAGMLGVRDCVKWAGERRAIVALSGLEGRETYVSMRDGLLQFLAHCYRVQIHTGLGDGGRNWK